jgi:hypothetical protein
MALLKVGETVELAKPLPGYPEGSRGTVVESSHGGVMVRFEDTGHVMLMRPDEVRIVGPST